MVQVVSQNPIIPLSAIIQKTMADNGIMEPQKTGLQPKKGVNKTPFGAQTCGGNPHYPIIRKPIGMDNGFPDNGECSWGEVDPDFGDDRVECKHCSFFKQEMATQRFPADVWDKIVRVNHPANQWMFELAKVKDGWVTVTYPRTACYGGEPAPMPVGLKHRCDYFQPFNEVAIENATKEWWQQ